MKLEMRALKNIAAAAMTLAVVFGAASLKPVTANAAEASVLPPSKKKIPTSAFRTKLIRTSSCAA